MEDADHNKLFVGGISWETTEDVLREHFGKYGAVLGTVVAKDRNSGSPRGFAFVTLSEPSAVDRALQDSHQICSRTVEVKRAIPRSDQQSQQLHKGLSRNVDGTDGRSSYQFRTKKIFVGGLSAHLSEEEFRGYFEKFGKITDVVVMHDNVTHRPRGFGFITFDSEDSVEQVVRDNFHELTGKFVEVKKAVPKDGPGNSSNGSKGRLSGGIISSSNFYEEGNYATYNARLGHLPSEYGNGPIYSYGTGIFSGGYPGGVYGGVGYGFNPMLPRSPWSPAMFGVRGNLMPYGSSAPLYHTYLSGGPGVLGLASTGYNGIFGAGFGVKMNHLGSGDALNAAESTYTQTRWNPKETNIFTIVRDLGDGASKQSRKGNDK